MKLVSYLSDGRFEVAACRNGMLYPIGDVPQAGINSMLENISKWIAREDEIVGQVNPIPMDQVTLAPPIPKPEKIICIGLNYADHAAESGAAIPEEPVVFNKFPTALRAHGEAIELPAASDSVDYEAELVVVIGKEAKHLTKSNAMGCIAGYTCGHDVSARDWQKNKPQGQWLCGKSFDSFAPIGPVLVTPDEIGDPHHLNISFRLNGETMQNSNTNQLIFKIDELLVYLSQVCTLRPGDLLFTGTGPGVGAARKPPVFLKAGDVAEVEIEKIGILTNPVINAPIK